MDLQQLGDPAGPDDSSGPVRIERTRATGPIAARPRLGLTVPGAVGGVLLIGAIAFGANLGAARTTGDNAPDPSFQAAAVVQMEPTEVPEPAEKTDAPAATVKVDDGLDEPAADVPKDPEPAEEAAPTKEPTPEPEPTDKPTPKPTEKPVDRPILSMSLAIKEGGVLVDWSACDVAGADYYKVVRSTDSTVNWPKGDNDELIAAVEIGGATKAWDGDAKSGQKAWYRAFCVRRTDDGYKVLAASEARAIVAPDREYTPKPTPHPEPSAMWIQAGASGGNVTITWQALGAEGFSHYRILRKTDGDAQVIAEVEDASTTSYVDDAVDVGQTYAFAIQAKGHIGDDWFLLGSTEWATVTVE